MRRTIEFLLVVLVLSLGTTFVRADGHDEAVARRLKSETWLSQTRLTSLPCGVTRNGTTIPCWIDRDEVTNDANRFRVWLVGGLDGTESSVRATLTTLRWFHTSADAESLRKSFSLSAVLIANPDGWATQRGEHNESGGQPAREFPPAPDAYVDVKAPESQYLWRWLGSQAPDTVVEFQQAVAQVPAASAADSRRLVIQLPQVAAANMGTIPASSISVKPDATEQDILARFKESLLQVTRHSAAWQEFQKRVTRTPLEVAKQLSQHYGHSLKTVQYIPAIAVVGRQRLSQLTGDPLHRAGIDQLVAPYRDGRQRAISDKPSGSDFSGHLLFGELALSTRDDKLIALVKAAANFGFDDNGQPREAMPSHVEMSDAVFMSCPLLAVAGHLTGDVKYHDLCVRHLAFMRKLCARADGLYRNSPLNDAAWGRGNGFPALGLAWALEFLPADHPERPQMLAAFREHLHALTKHQDATGMWHQVIDHPESYRELTATSMITYAMLRGIQFGWLDRKTFEPHIYAAWPALKVRIAANGGLIDVCEGTGKQTSLRAYLDRKAVLGRDDRGGAMALLVSVEMARFLAGSTASK